MVDSNVKAAAIGMIIPILVLFFVGIALLTKTSYQSSHIGTLIDAHISYQGRNGYIVVEKFQYGELKNHTCLVPRFTATYSKENVARDHAKKKKRGTTRKIWVRKLDHCFDSRIREYYLQTALGFMSPLFFVCFIAIIAACYAGVRKCLDTFDFSDCCSCDSCFQSTYAHPSRNIPPEPPSSNQGQIKEKVTDSSLQLHEVELGES